MEALIFLLVFAALGVGGAESLRMEQRDREITFLDGCIDKSKTYEEQELCFKIFEVDKKK